MRGSRRISTWTTTLILLAVAIIYFTWVNQAPSNAPTTKIEVVPVQTRDIQDTILEMGTVDIGKMVIASAPVATKLMKINVKQGDKVQKGQVLFLLDKSELLTDEKEAQSVMDKAKTDLDKLKKQPEANDVGQAETAYVQASTSFLNAQQTMKTNEQLFKENFLSQVAYQQSKDDWDIAKRKLDLARQAYDKATEVPPREDIAKAEADVEKAKQDLKKVEDQLDICEYKAPFNATVLDCYIKPLDWEIHPDGVPLAKGNAVVRIGDPKQAMINIDIFESEIGKVSHGQKAVITSDTLGKKEFHGVVDEIGSFAVPAGNLRKFPVSIKVNSDNVEFKPGTSVEVKLITGERKSVPAIPLRCVQEDNGNLRVTVLRGEKREFVNVTTGLDDGKYIEIVKGLSVGDRVIAEQEK
jgi:HlyD family secretion protein